MSRPSSTSPFSRTTPLATVRREQVQSGDPLLDVAMPTNQYDNVPPPPTSSAAIVSNPPVVKPGENFVPQASNPFRQVSAQDTIELLSEQLFQICRKQPISFDDQQSDLRGLYQLAASKSWQSIVSISAKLLSENKILQPDEIRLVNILRFEALFRMKMYDDLNIELNTTLMLYDGVQSSGAEISIELYNFLVSLRMLQSEVKLMTGHSLEALEHLHQTSNWVQTTSFPHTSIQMYWIWQIKCHEVNSNMRSRNWKGSLKLLRNMMLLLESYFPTVSDEEDRELLVKAKIVLLLRSAKLLLQVGSIKSSTEHVVFANNLASESNRSTDGYIASLLLLSSGLLQFAEEKFEQALNTFAVVVDFDYTHSPEFTGELTATTSKGKAVWSVLAIGKEECPKAAALNNFAICSLYLKRNISAINKIEELITEDPVRFMTDAVVFNLCTMYDLSFAPDASSAKKKALQKLATRYGINDPILHWRSFRLN